MTIKTVLISLSSISCAAPLYAGQVVFTQSDFLNRYQYGHSANAIQTTVTSDEGIKFTLTIRNAKGGKVSIGNRSNNGFIAVTQGNENRIDKGQGLTFSLAIDHGSTKRKLDKLSIGGLSYSWLNLGSPDELSQIREFRIIAKKKQTVVTGPFYDRSIRASNLGTFAHLPTDPKQLANWKMTNILTSDCPTRFESITFNYKLSRN